MPWTMKSAQKHTHAADTEKKKSQWSKVANSVLKKTGDEAKAVKSANAVVKKTDGAAKAVKSAGAAMKKKVKKD